MNQGLARCEFKASFWRSAMHSESLSKQHLKISKEPCCLQECPLHQCRAPIVQLWPAESTWCTLSCFDVIVRFKSEAFPVYRWCRFVSSASNLVSSTWPFQSLAAARYCDVDFQGFPPGFPPFPGLANELTRKWRFSASMDPAGRGCAAGISTKWLPTKWISTCRVSAWHAQHTQRSAHATWCARGSA